jgi:hypothetical protein
MIIRKFKTKDTKEVACLISNTYKKFNCLDYFDPKAAKEYIDFFNPKISSVEKIHKVFSKATIFYVVVDNGKIIGAIRGTSKRISSLFVEGNQHKQGIGKNCF